MIFGKKNKEESTNNATLATPNVTGAPITAQAEVPQVASNPMLQQQPVAPTVQPAPVAAPVPGAPVATPVAQAPVAPEPTVSASTATAPAQPHEATNEEINAQAQEVLDAIKKEDPDKGREKRSVKLNSYRYSIINTMNKKEQGTFDAETEDEVRNYLESQGYQVLEIKLRSKFDVDLGGASFKAGDLSFSLTQLSTYIKSGIPLVDSMRILAKQTTKPAHKKIFGQVVYELLRGESFSIALARQGKAFPPLLINMVKTSEMTGDLPSILDDMAEYYTSMDQTKKQMKSAMIYPVVILTLAVGVLIFMLVYLVPQFASMFSENDAKLPGITLAVLGASEFIQNYWYILLLVIGGLIGGFTVAFKKSTAFRTGVQTFLMHVPVVKNIIIYKEISNFTKTFASLLNHGVFITDSMEILSKITDNEVYKRIINKTLANLAKGESVSSAFQGEWAIPIVAYEMIVTGENTGQLGNMMEKVAAHFQLLHKNIIDQLKSLMEPFMIIMLAGIVAVILLSIVTPMFSIYSQIK